MTLDEGFDCGGEVIISRIEPTSNLAGDISRYVISPMLGGIEGYYSDRIVVLACNQIPDDGFDICSFNISLPEVASDGSEVVEHEVNGLIVNVLGDQRWRPRGAYRRASLCGSMQAKRNFVGGLDMFHNDCIVCRIDLHQHRAQVRNDLVKRVIVDSI